MLTLPRDNKVPTRATRYYSPALRNGRDTVDRKLRGCERCATIAEPAPIDVKVVGRDLVFPHDNKVARGIRAYWSARKEGSPKGRALRLSEALP